MISFDRMTDANINPVEVVKIPNSWNRAVYRFSFKFFLLIIVVRKNDPHIAILALFRGFIWIIIDGKK
jgi:hypothetical protein